MFYWFFFPPGVLSVGKGLPPLLSWLVLTHPAMPSLQAVPCPSTERVSEPWLHGRLGSFILCSPDRLQHSLTHLARV